MERRLDALEKANQQRELEWSDWFDKFRRLYARLAKRMQDAAIADGEAPQSPQDAPESTIPRPAGYGAPPHQRDSIAARRRAMRGF